LQIWPLLDRLAVVEDDGGGLAAELQADPGEIGRAGGRDGPPRRRGTSERHFVHAGMGDEELTDGAVTGEHAHDARR